MLGMSSEFHHRSATLTPRDARACCARHMEDGMGPKYVQCISELPKNGSATIDKRELRACAASPAR